MILTVAFTAVCASAGWLNFDRVGLQLIEDSWGSSIKEVLDGFRENPSRTFCHRSFENVPTPILTFSRCFIKDRSAEQEEEWTYLDNDALVKERVLLGRHDKVVRLVLVVDDILQVDARGAVQLFEELLVEDERHAADLLHPSLRLALAVHQIRRDGDGQPPPEFLPLESCQHIAQMD